MHLIVDKEMTNDNNDTIQTGLLAKQKALPFLRSAEDKDCSRLPL